MSNDLLMLRGEAPGEYNLAPGEPVFLQSSYWCNHPLVSLKANIKYPPFGGQSDLIRLIHMTNPNAKKHVVITNGAKHALLAAFHAYRWVENKRVASLPAPYWPSYPTLLKFNGISLVSPENAMPGDLRIITSPNNPDGAESVADCDVWDAAYFDPIYGATVVPNHKVSIWSAAKMFGLSGLRIGYASTDDDLLAAKMREYVEQTTSGVCNDAQARFVHVLENTRHEGSGVAVERMKVRQKLVENGKLFGQHMAGHVVEVKGISGVGMFAWARFAKDITPDLLAAKVKAVPGAACGVPGFWWRFSLGQEPDYTDRALLKLREALDRQV